MVGTNISIGTKVFGGFILLIIVGVLVGASGFISLDGVVKAAKLEELTNQIAIQILEARRYEKNLILRRDEESYKNLLKTLDDMKGLSSKLKASLTSQQGSADKIAAGVEAYLKVANELKRLEDDDSVILKELQAKAAEMTTMATQETDKAASETKSAILQSNAGTLKDDALKRMKDVVNVGHDILKHFHDSGKEQPEALDTVRNMHFQGDNYYFVVKEDLTLIAHGSDRKLEGMDFGKIADKKTGKTFMREIVENAVKNGESYTEYFWNKPGMGNAVFPKVTYAKYYKPWGIIICAGAYVDDVEQEVARTGALLQEGFDRLQQANSIFGLTMQARLNALYYFAFQENAEKVGENLSALKALPLATESIKKDADVYTEKFTQRVKNNEKRNAGILQIQQAAREITDDVHTVGTSAQNSFSSSSSQGKTFIIALIIAGALGGIAVALSLLRSITKPLNRAISGLKEAADQVSLAAGQVAGSSHSLAEGASQQAASLEETSSSLEEMSTMTRQNADNSRQANQLMKEADQSVNKANTSMTELMSSMDEISQASEETQKIIKTIDEIAFQTNLLALNAAVEAARAGEAGAGFAVVADEVRSLAMRAADAARNTAVLIEGTVKRVKDGCDLVVKTGKDFNDVASGVTKSVELIGEISVASQEQSQGLEQINRAVTEMDTVTQQNAATAEESASAAQQMNAQAEVLKGFVQDLASLSGGRNSGSTAFGVAEETVSVRASTRINQPSLQHTSRRSNGSAHEKTARRELAVGSESRVSPEKLIPFDDDFKDF